MKELVQAVKQWGVDKGLHKVGHLAQARYTLKETAELLDAYADSDIDAINDAIGDILVTLIVGASNDDGIYRSFSDFIVESEYFGWINKGEGFNEDYQSLISQVLLLESKCNVEIIDDLTYYYSAVCLAGCLCSVNSLFNQALSLQDCLQLAYNEIKNRKGKLVNGQFIKD